MYSCCIWQSSPASPQRILGGWMSFFSSLFFTTVMDLMNCLTSSSQCRIAFKWKYICNFTQTDVKKKKEKPKTPRLAEEQEPPGTCSRKCDESRVWDEPKRHHALHLRPLLAASAFLVASGRRKCPLWLCKRLHSRLLALCLYVAVPHIKQTNRILWMMLNPIQGGRRSLVCGQSRPRLAYSEFSPHYQTAHEGNTWEPCWAETNVFGAAGKGINAKTTGDPSVSIISRDEHLSKCVFPLGTSWLVRRLCTLIHMQVCFVGFLIMAGGKALSKTRRRWAGV